ncbi:MAG TPA: FMN-binding protein [Myxococcota bacterium]|jgi:Na+-translocating ferredoxin:NAD+ oxidoreductase RnfG subunit|nr:FMN-binding protein [Myxococcota bacterium]
MASEERGTARLLRAASLGLAALLLPTLLGATVYHTEDEAVAIAFPDATRVESTNVVLDDDLQAKVSAQVGYPIKERLLVLREAYRGDVLLGRAFALDEIAKTLPFRFLVALRPDGAVDQVLVLTYRESRGAEIERSTFREQYEGKTLKDPIRRGEDIRNVSGATISVDSLSRGVRRALALWAALADSPQLARARAHAEAR